MITISNVNFRSRIDGYKFNMPENEMFYHFFPQTYQN